MRIVLVAFKRNINLNSKIKSCLTLTNNVSIINNACCSFSQFSKCWTKSTILNNNRKVFNGNLILPIRSYKYDTKEKNKSTAMIMTALVVVVLGLSYAAVPLYRIYCQKTGTGMQAVAKVEELNEKVAKMKKVESRKIKVIFDAEKSSRLAWDFKPSQQSIVCSPGETVLAFYTAKNVLDRPVNGIATYTILPYEAGKYFNKIQCFCFEEQQLNANEEVDLPVFFFIDPEFNRDPYLFDVNEIILSYNFFETKEGYKLPKPPGYKAHYPSVDKIKETNVSLNQ